MKHQIYNISTDSFSTEEVEATVESTEQLVINARSERNGLLSETDWASGTDVTMSADMKSYRQALRDVPLQAGFPSTITWPQEPST